MVEKFYALGVINKLLNIKGSSCGYIHQTRKKSQRLSLINKRIASRLEELFKLPKTIRDSSGLKRY